MSGIFFGESGWSNDSCELFYEQYFANGPATKVLDFVINFWLNNKDDAILMIYKLATNFLVMLTLLNMRYAFYELFGVNYDKDEFNLDVDEVRREINRKTTS